MTHRFIQALTCVVALACCGVWASPPNVLFLTVDTLRADRLGSYGYDLETTPVLDELARDALLFEDAVCETPLTGPSFCSMLTGQYPRLTGTTRNGLRLPDGIRTVVQQYQDAGYYTFCVQSNWTLKAKLSGLDRGFDVYDDGFNKKRWGFALGERTADEVTARARELFEARPGDQPFFAWVHYSDPHAPYKLHRKFNPHGKGAFWLKNKEKVRLKYDSEVRFTDHHIGELLPVVPEDTVIVFLSDHGESLYEHDYLGHGRRIFQQGLHVPLFIRGPGIAPGRVAHPVRGVDVAPTLLALAGLEAAPSMLGVNLLSGALPEERIRVVETYGGAVPKVPGAKEVMANAGPIRQGVITGPWKLILAGHRESLFHLGEDPGELDDLAGREPGRVAELRAHIETWDSETQRVAEGKSDLNEEDWEALESLGYLD